MQNDQQSTVQPQQPIQMAPVYSPEQIDIIRRGNKKKLTWALICLIGPSVLLVVSFMSYAVINFVTGSTSASETGSATPSTSQTIFNIIFFLIGATAIITWLPGIIAGIVLLTQRKKI